MARSAWGYRQGPPENEAWGAAAPFAAQFSISGSQWCLQSLTYFSNILWCLLPGLEIKGRAAAWSAIL